VLVSNVEFSKTVNVFGLFHNLPFIFLDQATRPIKYIKAASTHNIVLLPSHSTIAVDKGYFYRQRYYFIIRWNGI